MSIVSESEPGGQRTFSGVRKAIDVPIVDDATPRRNPAELAGKEICYRSLFCS